MILVCEKKCLKYTYEQRFTLYAYEYFLTVPSLLWYKATNARYSMRIKLSAIVISMKRVRFTIRLIIY